MTSVISITTPLGADVFLIRRMKGKEELGRLSEFELDLLSEQADIDLDQVVGKRVTLHLELPDSKRHFNGYVTRLAQVGMHGRYHLYRATVMPWLWFLTRTRNCRIFQDKTVPDIIKEVFDAHPQIADVKVDLIDDYGLWDYCVQYRESDFDFVSRLMEHEGIYYYFTHTDGKHTLVLADSPSAHKPAEGCESLPFVPLDRVVRPNFDYVDEWLISREVQPGAYALSDFDFEKPSVDLQSKREIVQGHALSEYEIYDYPGEYVVRDDGELYARTRIEEMHAKFERISGKTNARGLAVGNLFSLERHPRQDQNAEYLIVSTEFDWRHDDYEATEAAGSSDKFSFTAINSRTPFRSERLTRKPVVQGLQTAIVVGAAGEEIYTDKYGRVKVHFHWDRFDKRDENSSCWIRVSQNWGGKGWGGMFIPHVGQECIVQFLEGDPDRPLVTGRVYNAEQMPPVALPAGKTQSIIRDHGGNEIKMEGNGGAQQIKMFSPTGNTTFAIGAPGSPGNGIEGLTDLFFTMTVGEDWRETVHGSKFEEVFGNNKKLIRGDVTTMIWGHKNEQIKGFEQKHVLGNSWTNIVGAKEETILGGSLSVIVGGKTEILTPFGVKFHIGYQFNSSPRTVELNKAIKAENDGKLLKKIQTETTKIGDQVLNITGSKFEKIATIVRKIKGKQDEKISELTQQIGKLETKVDGLHKVVAGTISLESKGQMHIKAPMVTFSKDVDVMGDVGVFGDTLAFGSVFVAKK